MFSKEFQAIVKLTVKPISNIEPYISQFCDNIESIYVSLLEKKYTDEYYRGFAEAIRNKLEIMILESNHKHLVEFRDIIGVQKQLGFIAHLKSTSTISKEVLLHWEANFELIEYWIKEEKTEKRIKNEQKSASRLSYKLICNDFDNDIKKLHKLLRGKIIRYDTTVEQLRNIFSEVELGKVKPIRWNEDNAAEMVFFYLALTDNGFIETESRINWSRLECCFVKPDGTKFRNLKNYKSPLIAGKDGILSSDKIEAINNILTQMLN